MLATERFEHLFIPEPNTGCWLWTGCLNPKGYGNFHYHGKTRLSHGAAYEMFVGPIPEGCEVDHTCRQRSCVNPRHLEAVTHRINLLRGHTVTAYHASRTHCPQGHPYDATNTVIENDGGRKCLICKRHYVKRWHQRRAAATVAA